MPQLRKVLPGDLITADQMNAIIDEIISLNQRVGAAATADTVVITDLIPPSGTVQLGHELQVIGRNFRFTAGGLKLYIDDQRIDQLTTASDERIVFNVPTTFTNVPAEGRSATLTVNNDRTSAQRTLTLMPALALSGAVDVVFLGFAATAGSPAPANTPTAGQPFTLRCRLRSRATTFASFTISPVVTVGTNQDQWQSNVRVLDSSEAEVGSRQIPVAPNEEKVFFVRISPVPGGTSGTPFTLTINATSGGVTGTTGKLRYTVGTAADEPDDSITLNFALAEVHPTAASGDVTATRIALKAGADVKLGLTATFRVAGSYDITSTLFAGSNWEAVRVPSTTPSPMSISSGELANPDGLARKTLEFGVRPIPLVTPSATGEVEFKVKRSGQTRSRSYFMDLQLLP